MNKKLLLIAIAGVLIVSVLTFVLMTRIDPTDRYYPQLEQIFSRSSLSDGYPTARVLTLSPSEGFASFVLSISSSISTLVKDIGNSILSLFIMDASANTCTWIGAGAGNWNDAARWSGCGATIPQNGDSVIFSGASSSAVSVNVATNTLASLSVNSGYTSTITININQTNSWGTVSFGSGTTGTIVVQNYILYTGSMTLVSGATLSMTTGVIRVSGNWNSSVGTFTYGTGTVIFDASATLTTPGVVGTIYFYNLTIGNAVTLTLASNIRMSYNLSIGGAGGGSITSVTSYRVYVDGTFTAGSGVTTFNECLVYDGTSATLPSYITTYRSLIFFGTALSYNLGANTTTTEDCPLVSYSFGVTQNGGGVSLNGFDLTVNGSGLYINTVNPSVLTTGDSTVIINGSVIINTTASYITSTTGGAWTVSGAWTNNSTSSSWSFFATSITFTSSTSRTMKFGNLPIGPPTAEFFSSVSFIPSSGTPTFTMTTNALLWDTSSALTISSATLVTSGLALTGGSVVIDNNGVLTASSSTITLADDWDSSDGIFNPGTSLVKFISNSASITVVLASVNPGFYNVEFLAPVTVTYTITGNLYVSETLNISSTTAFTSTLATTYQVHGTDLEIGLLGRLNLNGSTSTLSFDTVDIVTSGYIVFGSTTWDIYISWSNASTSGSWNVGTSIVNFNMTIPTTFIPSSSITEFYTLNLKNAIYTLSTNDLTVTNLNIYSTLIMTGLDIKFKILNVTVSGHLKDGSVTTDRLNMTTDIHPLTLKEFTVYTTISVVDTDIEFIIGSTAGANITLTFYPLPATYELTRNSILLETEQARYNTGVVFTHTGGWSSTDSMIITYTQITPQLVTDFVQIMAFTIFVIVIGGLLIVGYVIHKRRTR